MALIQNGAEKNIEFDRYRLSSPAIKGRGADLVISIPRTSFGRKKREIWEKMFSLINKRLGKEIFILEKIEDIDYDNVEFKIDL